MQKFGKNTSITMQQTSKWRGETFIKIQRKYQHTDALLDNRACQLCACLGSCGKILIHYLWDPGHINATMKGQKIDFVTFICP